MSAADDLCSDAYDAAHNYTTRRRIKGFLKNTAANMLNMKQGFGTSRSEIAKNVGKAVAVTVAKQGGLAIVKKGVAAIPLVGSLTGPIVDLAQKKIESKWDMRVVKNLRSKLNGGGGKVGEMNELLLMPATENEVKLLEHTVAKLKDAIRKMTDAHNDAAQKIAKANSCGSYYEAAKAFYYYAHRLDRLKTYLALIEAWVKEVGDAVERYDATVIGYELDLMEALGRIFTPTQEMKKWHQSCCNPKDCYFGQ